MNRRKPKLSDRLSASYDGLIYLLSILREHYPPVSVLASQTLFSAPSCV